VSRSWIVGGALRDELLGREVTDIDIAVERDPQQAARELAAELRGPVFQLS
jgi:poly(A) polymerase